MQVQELTEWFAETLAERHGCRWDGRGKESRAPCGHCAETAAALTEAWEKRFVTGKE